MPEGARVLDSTSAMRRRVASTFARARSHSLALVLLAITAVWLLAASRWVITDTVVPWDAKNQFYAFFRFLALALNEGYSPFWNPFHYGGHPSVADPQSLVFAPAFVLWALIDAAPSIRAFDFLVYAHLLVGGLSVGVLGWRAGWPLSASLLAAVVFMFGGPASGRLQHTGMILSYSLFPLALLLLQVAVQRRSLLVAAAFGVVAAMLALGRNHEALLLCFVLMAALAAEVATAGDRLRYVRERAAVMLTMGAVAASLLAAPLLLTLQFAALSNRPEVTIESSLEASLYPANLASLAVANVFGSLETTQNYWGPNYETLPEAPASDRSFNYLFIGAAPTIVLVWFGIAGGLLLRRGNRLMAGVLLVGALYTVGRYSPLYSLAFDYVPGISLFRRPIDGTFVLVAAIALLVGRLLTDYVREGIPRVAVWRLGAVAACAVGVVAWAVAFSERSHRGWASLLEVAKVAPIAALVVLALAPTLDGLVLGIDAALASSGPQMIEWRRHLHQHPELGNHETETAKFVAERLRAMGLEPRTGVARTGVVAVIEGGKPGKVVALRADMDALPVTEEVDLPFASKATSTYEGKPVGVMHACGHDSHVAMLLQAAQALVAVRKDLPGTIVLLFQPAEEGVPIAEQPSGAELMTKEGVLDDPKVDVVFGLHVFAGVPSGVIGYRRGPLLAAADRFEVIVQGRQTHGSAPWKGIDPIVVGSEIVTALQTIVSRTQNITHEPAVVTVGQFDAGVRNNIIPDRARLVGTIRTFDEAMRDSELAELKKDVENLGREAEDTLRDAGRAANEQMDAAANGEEKKAPELVGAGPQLDGDGFPVDLVTPPVIEPANPAAAAAAAAAADAPRAF